MIDQRSIGDQQFGLLFAVRRSVRYHHRRTRFFEAVNKGLSLLAMLSGLAAAATVLSTHGLVWPTAFVLVAEIFSAIYLIIGATRKALLHDNLARRFFELEKELVAAGQFSEKELERFTIARLAIEADEPPPLKVLDSICHNELLRAMGYPESCGDYVTIGRLQRLFSHFFDFREYAIKRQA